MVLRMSLKTKPPLMLCDQCVFAFFWFCPCCCWRAARLTAPPKAPKGPAGSEPKLWFKRTISVSVLLGLAETKWKFGPVAADRLGSGINDRSCAEIGLMVVTCPPGKIPERSACVGTLE